MSQLTIEIQGEGATNPAPGTHNIPDGEIVTITAFPDAGWVFRSWSWPGNDPAYAGWTDNPVSWPMSEDRHIIAVFDQAGGPPSSGLAPTCVYYYGGFNSIVKQRLIATAPRFVVLNTPGGSYPVTKPTPSDIAELQAAGIKVLSYVSTGNLIHFKYAADSPPNDRAFVRGCIETVAAEGCDGIFFDEGGVGNHRDPRWTGTIADRYYEAPAIDMYGNPNSWAGYTIEDYTSYAHSFGLITVEGTDFFAPQYLDPNVFGIVDYVLTDEHYSPRNPSGSEIGNTNKCWVIGREVYDAVTAANYTNDALDRGFAAAYHCSTYGTLATWYEDYIALLSPMPPTVTLQSGESKLITFEAVPHEAKVYQVSVDGLMGTFEVISPPGGY